MVSIASILKDIVVSRNGRCCLDQTRLEGINYIHREKGSSFPNYDTSWMSSKGQGGVAQIELLGQTNFVLNNGVHNFPFS